MCSYAVLDTLKTRIVIPLAITDKGQVKPLEVLAPLVEFEGEHYVLLTPQLSAVSVQRLTDPVGSLVAFRAREPTQDTHKLIDTGLVFRDS